MKTSKKAFDAVRIMREIRDRMSQEMKGMAPAEQIEYIQKRSGIRRDSEGSRERASDAKQ